jgi:uncharacterized integral membrane protein
MIRRFLRWLLLIALAAVLVAFAVANRQDVTLAFDPFDPAHPAIQGTLPLYMALLIAAIIGVVVGGCASWLQQSSWRRRARWSEAEVRALRTRLDASRSVPETRPAPPRLTIPPSAA